ncbi:MAG: hypothetical protein SFU86_21690 [Pirellulaceae bacterium]|nr:hypothetical protein [Pirellulaceae bacterium]
MPLLWIGLLPFDQKQLDASVQPFPAILDSGYSGQLLLAEEHVRRWTPFGPCLDQTAHRLIPQVPETPGAAKRTGEARSTVIVNDSWTATCYRFRILVFSARLLENRQIRSQRELLPDRHIASRAELVPLELRQGRYGVNVIRATELDRHRQHEETAALLAAWSKNIAQAPAASNQIPAAYPRLPVLSLQALIDNDYQVFLRKSHSRPVAGRPLPPHGRLFVGRAPTASAPVGKPAPLRID